MRSSERVVRRKVTPKPTRAGRQSKNSRNSRHSRLSQYSQHSQHSNLTKTQETSKISKTEMSKVGKEVKGKEVKPKKVKETSIIKENKTPKTDSKEVEVDPTKGSDEGKEKKSNGSKKEVKKEVKEEEKKEKKSGSKKVVKEKKMEKSNVSKAEKSKSRKSKQEKKSEMKEAEKKQEKTNKKSKKESKMDKPKEEEKSKDVKEDKVKEKEAKGSKEKQEKKPKEEPKNPLEISAKTCKDFKKDPKYKKQQEEKEKKEKEEKEKKAKEKAKKVEKKTKEPKKLDRKGRKTKEKQKEKTKVTKELKKAQPKKEITARTKLQMIIQAVNAVRASKEKGKGSKEHVKPRARRLLPGDSLYTWKVNRLVGEGGFGAVYEVEDDKGKKYAMKTEHVEAKLRTLKMEVVVMRALKDNFRLDHFCEMIDSGRDLMYNFLVMTLIGKTLSELRKSTKHGYFSLGCVLGIGMEAMEAIQHIHDAGYLHRDLKPGNFAISATDNRKIILFDFGLCRRILDKDRGIRKPRWATGFRGTLKYASISVHISREMCFKDDLESWLYMQAEMTVGGLPWAFEDDVQKVAIMKEKARDEGLKKFIGKCPVEYMVIMDYIDELLYYDHPNYKGIINMLEKCIASNGRSKYPYDWEPGAPVNDVVL